MIGVKDWVILGDPGLILLYHLTEVQMGCEMVNDHKVRVIELCTAGVVVAHVIRGKHVLFLYLPVSTKLMHTCHLTSILLKVRP